MVGASGFKMRILSRLKKIANYNFGETTGWKLLWDGRNVSFGVKWCEKVKVRVKNKMLKVNGSKASAKKQKILGKNQSRKKKFWKKKYVLF